MARASSVSRETGADTPPEQAAPPRPGYGLPRHYYTDPAVFERDMQRIFLRHWLCAGHVSALPGPGDYCTLRIENESVILARGANGALGAMLNVCRHRGAEICAPGAGHAKSFVCPYHGWTYGLDGSLQAARHMPANFDCAAHGLRRVHLREAEGMIFISLAETPLRFDHVAEVLHHSCGRYGWAEARIAHRETYPLAANWKLAVENYVECYHCAPAHPEYSKLHVLEQPAWRIAGLNAKMEARTCALGLDVRSSDQWQNAAHGAEAVHAFRYALYDGIASGSEDGGPVAPLMGAFREYDGGVTSIHVGPASFLVAYADHGVIYRFVPRDVNACEMELIWLVRGDAREGIDYDRERLTWLWRVTSEADKRIIEHTARGVRSRFFEPGPLAPMEHNERRYIEWYLREIA